MSRAYVKGSKGIVTRFLLRLFRKARLRSSPARKRGAGSAGGGGAGGPAPQPGADRPLRRPGAHRHSSARCRAGRPCPTSAPRFAASGTPTRLRSAGGSRGPARLHGPARWGRPPALPAGRRPLPSSVPAFRPAMARAAGGSARAGRADFGLAGHAPRGQEAAAAGGLRSPGHGGPPPPSRWYRARHTAAVGNETAKYPQPPE